MKQCFTPQAGISDTAPLDRKPRLPTPSAPPLPEVETPKMIVIDRANWSMTTLTGALGTNSLISRSILPPFPLLPPFPEPPPVGWLSFFVRSSQTAGEC